MVEMVGMDYQVPEDHQDSQEEVVDQREKKEYQGLLDPREM